MSSSTTSAERTTTPTTTTTPTADRPPAGPPPDILVGEWNASTAATGKLELTIDGTGAFHHRGKPGMDWRGTVAAQGNRITFQHLDGHADTYDWSVTGGTLTLDGITYLKTDTGVGGTEAVAGEWIGVDDVFETLVFGRDGTLVRKYEGQGDASGGFTLRGTTLTATLGSSTATYTWRVADGFLYLTSAAGTTTQYARLS